MAITFERNIVERAVILQVERGDFGAFFPPVKLQLAQLCFVQKL